MSKSKMKVVWITNLLMPEVCKRIDKNESTSGSWIVALSEVLSREINLTIITTNISINKVEYFEENNISFYVIPTNKNSTNKKIENNTQNIFNDIINEVNPDIIHVHGTEYNQALLALNNDKIPVVISIQGILSEIYKEYYGGIALNRIVMGRTLRDYIRFDGLIEQRIKFKKRSKLEKLILNKAKYVIGRTTWDKAHVLEINRHIKYYKCNELLRKNFYIGEWSENDCEKHRIFISSCNYPLKGAHVVIEAIAKIKDKYPDIKLVIANSNLDDKDIKRNTGYKSYLNKLINKYNLNNSIVNLGALNAHEYYDELIKSNVFILASYIENSPNSLCEAMILGVPSIASVVGGVLDLGLDKKDVLNFPKGDSEYLSMLIQEIFDDKNLASELSRNSQVVGRERHNIEFIVEDIKKIYKDIIDDYSLK